MPQEDLNRTKFPNPKIRDILRCTISNAEPDINESVKISVEITAPYDSPNAVFGIDKDSTMEIINNDQYWKGKVTKGQIVCKEFTLKFKERKFYIVRVHLWYLPNEKNIGDHFLVQVKDSYLEDDRVRNLRNNIRSLKSLINDQNLSREQKIFRASIYWEGNHGDTYVYPEDTTKLSAKKKERVKYIRSKNDELLKQLKKEYDSLRTFIEFGRKAPLE